MEEINYNYRITDDVYSYEEIFLDIAKKYFPNLEQDISLSKLGLLGYLIESMSYVSKTSTFHRNILYNEYFLNSLQLDSSLNNWCKILNKDFNFSKPASLTAYMFIEHTNMQELCKYDRTIIDKRDTFIINGMKFMLPYDLVIYKDINDLTHSSYTFRYNIESVANYIDVENPVSGDYFKNTLVNGLDIGLSPNNTYIVFKIKLYQMEYNLFNREILDDELSNKTVYDIILPNSLCNMNMYHYSGLINKPELVTLLFNDNADNQSNLEKVAYYSYLEKDKVRISFSLNNKHFKPSVGDVVKIEYFTTKGSLGNFKNFFDNGIFDSKYTLQDRNINFDYILRPDPYGSSGGEDELSFYDKKTILMDMLRTRNTINTEYDLQYFINSIYADSDNLFKVSKVRDDIEKRLYNIFILMKDIKNNIIPTNTIDIKLSLVELEELSYKIKPGTFILYDKLQSKFRLLKDTETVETFLYDNTKLLYSTLFLYNINFKDYLSLDVYMNDMFKLYKTELIYKNDNDLDFISVDTFSVTRNSLIHINNYYIELYMQLISNNSVSMLNKNYSNTYYIYLILYNKNGFLCYFKVDYDNSGKLFININSDDEFTSYGSYKIFGGKSINGKDVTVSFTTDDISASLFIYKKTYDNTPRTLNGNNLVDTLDKNMRSAIGVYDSNIYTLLEALNVKDFKLLLNVNKVVNSECVYDSENQEMYIKQIPVIGATYFVNRNTHKYVMDYLYSFIDKTSELTQRLENNTTLSTKFYNTYGLSKMWQTDTTHIEINIGIYFKKSIDVNLIYDWIVKYIESINFTDSKDFAYSRFIRELESNFPEIDYTKFYNINNSNIQHFTTLNNEALDIITSDPEYIPEAICVGRTVNGDGVKYAINITPLSL